MGMCEWGFSFVRLFLYLWVYVHMYVCIVRYVPVCGYVFEGKGRLIIPIVINTSGLDCIV